jgi:hypothetical protein
MKLNIILPLVALTTVVSSNAAAQVSRDLGAPVQRAPGNFGDRFVRLPPQPTQACVFTEEASRGQRYCFGVQAKTSLPREVTRRVSSFLIPYGYGLKLYEVSFRDNGFGRKTDVVETLLCNVRSHQPNEAYGGPVTLNGGCNDVPDGNNRANYAELFKLEDITDAQRTSAWRNWAKTDNGACAVKILNNEARPAGNYVAAFDGLDRMPCYGTYFPLDDLSQFQPYGSPLKDAIVAMIIRSPYVTVRIYEDTARRGRSLNLVCGNYRFAGGMDKQISSAEITITAAPNTCQAANTEITAWEGIVFPSNNKPYP